ncbi:hypothetical protein NJF44_10695 [Pseudomonas guariconensis]|uniref:hypothetical protein n=1 Tax=Pseudomonas TaxID=286 RepID=UPI00209855E0|nr:MULTISPECIES: hypothetical protein [Pseudomonas]MCO7640755.1 hypothetical protein [Pseudomonas sp. S 311-6]MCO7515710.1 hypothetical protein [Pseudomonas putida]MCO7566449.1 hypothetical protein [Pseudomonas mosselii]MCO7595061.1 hypothetical protein [Pseudomonas guariconensis]MCO7605697.1 hypothetical protein [Pseudomonas guariconensis]
MDIRELPERKRALEDALRESIRSEIELFRSETGVDVAAVDVNVFRVHTAGEEAPPRSIGTVSVTLDL